MAQTSRSYPNRIRTTVKVRVTDNDGAQATAAAALAVDGTAPSGNNNQNAGGANGGGGSTSATFKASLLGAPIQKLKAALKKGVGVTCQVNRKATCAIEVVVLAKDAKRLKLARGKKAKKPVRVAKATVVTKGSGKKAVTLKLSKAAKKALKRGKGVVLVVRGTATASGTKVSLKRSVMLR